MRAKLAVAGALLLAAAVASAADRPIRFQHLGVEEGLSQSSVLAMHQDSVGFMWFGTEDGLNRFDGHEVVHYRSSRSSGMTSDYVVAIAEDGGGDLWLGTDGGGLLRFDRATDTFSRIEAGDGGRAAARVRTVVCDPAGSVWFGTRGAGVYRYDVVTGEVTAWRHEPDDEDSLLTMSSTVCCSTRPACCGQPPTAASTSGCRIAACFGTFVTIPRSRRARRATRPAPCTRTATARCGSARRTPASTASTG